MSSWCGLLANVVQLQSQSALLVGCIVLVQQTLGSSLIDALHCDLVSALGLGAIAFNGSYAIENSGTLNLYSGSVERSSDDNEAAVKVNAGAVFHMYGGKIGGNAKAILAYGTVNVSGGTVSAKRQAMEVYAGSEVTVSGNAALSVTGSGYSTIAIYGGTVNICGGTVTNDSGAAVYVPSGESTLNISGGVISTSLPCLNNSTTSKPSTRMPFCYSAAVI